MLVLLISRGLTALTFENVQFYLNANLLKQIIGIKSLYLLSKCIYWKVIAFINCYINCEVRGALNQIVKS